MKLRLSKISMNMNLFAVVCALFIVLAYNHLFWADLFKIINVYTLSGIFFAFNVLIILTGLTCIFVLIFGVRYLLKPFIMAVFIISAFISYFETKYGTVIDKSMIRNIMETDYREASELVTLSLAWHITVFGLLPSAALSFVRIQFKPARRELASRVLSFGIVLVLITVSAMTSYKELALTGREHKELRLSINPGYALYSAYKFAVRSGEEGGPVQPVGLDAYRRKPASNKKKTLIILVVGETARSREFSLNGYERKTNRYLPGDGVISFTRAYSCGTSTADSLPCMFSHLDRDNYSPSKAPRFENVLDVLSRSGVNVLWRDNNSGCKGICSRVETENMSGLSVPGLCNAEECYDEVLLSGLQKHIDRTNSDMLIVLHQKGSHGPAYYKRYPEKFSVFTPECTSSAPQDCGTDQILNAYDNTILYTDYFLHKTIDLLKRNERKYNTMMLYFSDHGESLGENGVFLHGLPYVIAPDEQKRVPFILWLSRQYASGYGLSRECLIRHRDDLYSHDNIFHSLLGGFGVGTEVYREDRDIFRQCETGNRSSQGSSKIRLSFPG
jgi:lipid A ethanolaminephosphotransferase